jgi:hypothetical protein
MPKTEYVCPTDKDTVLFSETEGSSQPGAEGPPVFDTFSFKLPERPATCPRCSKAYYRWECTKVESK